MKVSPKYKRFKHSSITGDTFTLSMVRSLIIRNLQGYKHYPNMPDSLRLQKQAQFVEIRRQKTDRMLSESERAYHPLLYADMLMLYYSSCGDTSPDDMLVHQHSHTPIYVFQAPRLMLNHDNCAVMVMSTHLIFEIGIGILILTLLIMGDVIYHDQS